MHKIVIELNEFTNDQPSIPLDKIADDVRQFVLNKLLNTGLSFTFKVTKEE